MTGTLGFTVLSNDATSPDSKKFLRRFFQKAALSLCVLF
jgi:hypothetical protein